MKSIPKNCVPISIVAFAVLHTVFITGCGTTVSLKSEIPAGEVTIDGNLQEWEGVSFVDISDERISIAINNDSVNLYIAGEIHDNELSERIRRTGLKLYLDYRGGRRKDVSISYPAFGRLTSTPVLGGFYDTLTEDQRERFDRNFERKRNGVMLEVPGLKIREIIPVDASNEFSVAIDNNSFEAQIPLDHSVRRKLYSGAELPKAIGIGLIVESPITMTAQGPMRTRGQMGAPGGGPVVIRQPGSMQRTEETEIWFSAELIYEK
jgi:hypothetical protein